MLKTAKLPTLIDRFQGPWAFLSNFYPVEVRLNFDLVNLEGDDFTYVSVEHAYQAAKTQNLKQRQKFTLNITPGQAKRVGRSLTLRPDWEEVKVEVMRQLLAQKFSGSVLRRKLLSTFTADLVEGNWWGDEFWGICQGNCTFGPHEPRGQNILGILLMGQRAQVVCEGSK